MNAEKEPSPQDTNELLRRILNAVGPEKRKPGFEIACAIVLALATTASAWCACQSKLWGGMQAARAGAAVRAGREGAVNSLAAPPSPFRMAEYPQKETAEVARQEQRRPMRLFPASLQDAWLNATAPQGLRPWLPSAVPFGTAFGLAPCLPIDCESLEFREEPCLLLTRFEV